MSSDSNTLNHAVAHQFDDLSQQDEAGELGMWLFLASEVMFFGGMFLAYTIYRMQDEEAFAEASQRLDVGLGALNTAILLTSSLTVALAGIAAEHSQRARLVAFLSLTICLGSTFLAIKFYEYHHKYVDHLIPLMGLPFEWSGKSPKEAALFFDLYFVMTGVHALHMVLGLGVMLVVLVMAGRGRLLGDAAAPVRVLGLYWHFVDIVWVFLFPLLYLVGIHHVS